MEGVAGLRWAARLAAGNRLRLLNLEWMDGWLVEVGRAATADPMVLQKALSGE